MSQPSNRRNMPLLIAAGAVVVAGIVSVAVGFNHAANSGVSRETATPSAAATSTATPAPAQIPYADCSTATFGSPLAPLGQPADPHVYPNVPGMSIDLTKLYEATITTANRGTIVVCLQPNLAPQTVNVFVTLSRNHFYDGIPWHRVVSAFVIQAGDPTCIGNVQAAPATPAAGCGSGGPGFKFSDEPVKQQYVDGSIAMANSGANTNGSQFFISIADNTKNLQPQYNLFGKVATGLDVITKIQQGDTIQSITVTEQQ